MASSKRFRGHSDFSQSFDGRGDHLSSRRIRRQGRPEIVGIRAKLDLERIHLLLGQQLRVIQRIAGHRESETL